MNDAELGHRLNFDGWPPCPRCGAEIGTAGFEHWGSVICATCANDIRRKIDTRNVWWRTNGESAIPPGLIEPKPKTK